MGAVLRQNYPKVEGLGITKHILHITVEKIIRRDKKSPKKSATW